MVTAAILERAKIENWTDEEVVTRVLAGETALFEIIMRRHNQRLYRAARAILRDDAEAEDVMQDAYVRAYQNLQQFAGRAKFSTWLTKIAVYEALARVERRRRIDELDAPDESGKGQMRLVSNLPDPEHQLSHNELRNLLEQAILALPDSYRAVLMLRDIEELSTAEAAECLDMTEDNVKVRLHRARGLLRKELYARAGATSSAAFQFMGVRCDRVVRRVFERLSAEDVSGQRV